MDLNFVFPMKPSEFKICISVESYDEKTAKNYRNCYVAESLQFSNYQRFPFQILISQIDDLNKDCVNSSGLYLIRFLKNKPSKSVTVGSVRVRSGRVGSGRVGSGRVGSGRFIVLNDSAGPNQVIHLDLNFLRFFLKVLEPI